jgi:hypothetical protein
MVSWSCPDLVTWLANPSRLREINSHLVEPRLVGMEKMTSQRRSVELHLQLGKEPCPKREVHMC